MLPASTAKEKVKDESDGEEGGTKTSAKKVKSPDDGTARASGLRDNDTTKDDISRLRDAVNAKLLQQSRVRGSLASSGLAQAKRVSPIIEEGISPTTVSRTQQSENQGPVRTASTTSTQSTESTGSSRTVTNQAPLRTPSYPFPYVPGTPRSWSSGAFQPFTTLSPTAVGPPVDARDTPGTGGSGFVSSLGTPNANPTFMPFGEDRRQEDPRFPTPNLYDLVLRLSSEPGLEQWWATISNILHDDFKVDRATLVVPTDSTDIQNAPWGQKATFSMNGVEEFVPHSVVEAQASQAKAFGTKRPEFRHEDSMSETFNETRPQRLHPERLRPRLEQRHSYAGSTRAGHSKEVKDVLGTLNDPATRGNKRPQGPLRTATHASGMSWSSCVTSASQHASVSSQSLRYPSSSDQDFSSAADDVDAGPHADIYSELRTLDREHRPLIEPEGIQRVLQRGRVVTVTRDYTYESSTSSNSQTSSNAAPPTRTAASISSHRGSIASTLLRDYEEYEQQPTSPWAQSPAPSPAIQHDEERNPFFASDEQQVEDSFAPAISPQDYSQLPQVEAIGIDHASTILHIPLIHPVLSQPTQSMNMTPQSKDRPEHRPRNDTLELQTKAPVAILSVLSETVPYPQNLVQSLKLLGPHLATTYFLAQQFAHVSAPNVIIRARKPILGDALMSGPLTVEPASFEDLVRSGKKVPPSAMSDVVTSPSEYSVRSRQSDTSSIIGTPGWDPATHGWTSSKSGSGTGSGTPGSAGAEKLDNYFDAKKRKNHKSAARTSSSAQNTPSKSTKSLTEAQEPPSSLLRDDDLTPRSERKPLRLSSEEDRANNAASKTDEKLPGKLESSINRQSAQRPQISRTADAREHKQHTMLHSHGADYHTSFGTPLDAPISELDFPGIVGHRRHSSHSEEMPPPSQRLLRLMLDSVPVQIFIAEPVTGEVKWVNEKLLQYRHQGFPDVTQVLQDPWQNIHPDDRDGFQSAYQQRLINKQQMSIKLRLLRFDGQYRWFYLRVAPLFDVQHRVVRWLGTMMDFHDQQQYEDQAAKQRHVQGLEKKYKALANSTPQIVFSAHKEKGITFCNTQWMQYSGQTEIEAMGQGFLNSVHPDDLVKCRFPMFQDGSNQPTNVPTSLPAEPKRSLSSSAMSSTASSETEKPYTSSDSSSSPVAQVPSIMPQRKLAELASTGILRATRDADGRPSYSTEVRLKSKDGNYRWHLVRVLLAGDSEDSDNEAIWYGSCTDINDHKTLERDLKETMDEKSRFLSNMSHEIRTPLNGITGMVNFLMDSNLTAEQMEHVNIIRTSTQGLRGLIDDILDLSKAEAGMITLSMDWLHPRALIEEINDLTSAMAMDKGLELNYLVEEDVPAVIKGDRFRIRQILLNTVGNAIKFTQQGEVFVRCSKQPDEDGDLAHDEMFIKFDIIDTGRGFTDKEAEFLFKRFSQIDGSSTRQHGGTGLGLVISRQLAQLHGGDMGATGVPDKGSTFSFYIKAKLASLHDGPPPPTPGAEILALTPGPGVPLAKFPSPPASLQSPSNEAKPMARFASELTETPGNTAGLSPGARKGSSPSISTISSNTSVRSGARSGSGSIASERSSISSFAPDQLATSAPGMTLSLPQDPKHARHSAPEIAKQPTPSNWNVQTASSLHTGILSPPMFSILVVAPLKYSREATVHHIDKTLPSNIPHQITARESLAEAQVLLGGVDPITFSHVVIVLNDVEEIISLMSIIFHSSSSTSVVLITNPAQRKQIMESETNDYEKLAIDGRLMFIFKPLKPSRLGLIFDPQKEREMSTDQNQDSAQQIAFNQKLVFEELTSRLNSKATRVLLVEDNKINQVVIHKYLAKSSSSMQVETAQDGVQCTDKVFAHPHDYYSVILCDLHMPNKDGYQTCRDIRHWERKNKHPALPIIALSANVLGDVWQKCAEVGFNDYITKPVDFKDLGKVLLKFLDPTDPTKPHELMKSRRANTRGPSHLR